MESLLVSEIYSNILFEKEEFDLIFSLFEKSYDASLRMATIEGGWLYGCKNKIVFASPEPAFLTLSFRKIDQIVKSLEMADYIFPNKKHLSNKLTSLLMQILSSINDTTDKINNLLQSK